MIPRIKIEKQRLIYASAVGVVLSFILGFGNFTQQLFVNGVLGQASSIYDAFTPSGFVRPQGFLEWLGSFYFAWHLPLCVVTCYCAFRYRTTRPLFLALSLGIFITLTAVDTAYALPDPQLRPNLPESYLSNALGSPVIAFFLCLLLLFVEKVAPHLNLKREWAHVLIPLFAGALAFLILFVAVKNMFWVTKSTVSALIKPPFAANYSANLVDKKEDRFGVFLNSSIPPEKLSWTGKFVKMHLGTSHPEKKAQVDLYVFDSCPFKDTATLVSQHSKPVFSMRDVSRIGLAFDDGMGSFSIYSPKQSNGHWSLSEEEVGMFSIKPAKEKGNLDITLFSSPDSSVRHQDWSGTTYYRVDAMLIGDNEDLVPRRLSLVTDSNQMTYKANANQEERIDEKMHCRPIDAETDGRLTANGPVVTALLGISYPPPRTYQDLKRAEHRTVIKGLNGWLSADNVAADELENYISSGKLSFLSIQGNFEELYIDKARQDSRRQSWLYLQEGSVSGAVEGEFVRFDGETDVVALDGGRVTKTRWERISSGVKWLIFLLPGALGFLVKAFWDIWKRDEILLEA